MIPLAPLWPLCSHFALPTLKTVAGLTGSWRDPVLAIRGEFGGFMTGSPLACQ